MGDFDRIQTGGTKNDSKKIALMVVLGLVLVGVLGSHFTKPGPQTASAATDLLPASAPESAGGGQTPEVALSGLKEDPTDNLLRNTVVDDPSLSGVPRNPFRMSTSWLTSSTKVKPVAVEPVKPVEPQHTPNTRV